MAERLLQLDDVRHIDTPDKIASLFQKIGYNANAQQLAIDDLELPQRSAEAIWDAYMIADYKRGSESLQVLLFQLHPDEWQSPSVVWIDGHYVLVVTLDLNGDDFLALIMTEVTDI